MVLDAFRLQLPDHIDEGATAPDRGKLARIPHEYEAIDTAQCIEQGGELLFGEHRAFVDDHGPVVAAPFSASRNSVAPSFRIVALTVAHQELCDREATVHFGLGFELHTRLPGRCEQ